ncbi:MAG: HAMP domain-containing sensor histidine kinase [Anaerolineae bacterium]
MTAVTTEPTSQLNFAQEVRSDRLAGLWKLTFFGAIGIAWIALLVTVTGRSWIGATITPAALVCIGCIATRQLLASNRYEAAVWAYVIGIMAGMGYGIYAGQFLLAFTFPLVIIMVGLLLPVRATMLTLVVCVAISLFVPMINQAATTINGQQLFAVLLMGIAAGLAAQTSGELYGIAEWALESYRKERTVKNQLFDSQQEVERSYMRQKALAEQLQETNKELELARAAALEAKNVRGQFLANMSHELRTPLNAIIGFSETMLNFPMMYENIDLPNAYRNDMGQIYNSGKHLLQLINDILDLSKVDAGKLDLEIEEVELEGLFKGVLATAAGLVGDKPIKLKRQTPSVLPHVHADPLRLRQVILNLMSNAAKFTDSGSITLGARDEGTGEVTIWVTDTGIGIQPQDIDHIFDEFRQGQSGRKKGRAGSGLGLAISRQLLRLMGGQIWVESKLGHGSTFYFTVPVADPEDPMTESQPSQVANPAQLSRV